MRNFRRMGGEPFLWGALGEGPSGSQLVAPNAPTGTAVTGSAEISGGRWRLDGGDVGGLAAVGVGRQEGVDDLQRRPAPSVNRRPSARTLASFHLRAPRAVSGSVHSAARTPGTLLAAIETPVPVQHHTMPRSARPSPTAAPTAWPTSGQGSPLAEHDELVPGLGEVPLDGLGHRGDLVGADGDAHVDPRSSHRRCADHRSGLSSTRCSTTRPSTASTSTRPRRVGGSSAE